MCSPVVERIVRERIAKEGRPQISRRNLLKFGGMTAGLAAASMVSPIQRARAQEISGVIDLSYTFSTNMPTYLPGETPTREDYVTVENDGFYIQRWNYTEHAGTHMDIPAHFVSDGVTVDRYPPALLVSPAVVIDISAKAEEDPDAMLDLADIEAWESANGELPLGAVVFMYSGWESRWPDVEMFRNADADGVMHFPGFSPEAAEFLVTEREIHGIAVDTLSLDPGPSATFDVHLTILSAGKYGIEGVTNLVNLMENPGAMVVAGVPRWEEGSGGPCRLLAII